MNELSDGLFLMGMGLGTVFLFLALLIGATHGIFLLFGDKSEPAPAPSGPGTPGAGMPPSLRAAIITAAITQYKKSRGRDG